MGSPELWWADFTLRYQDMDEKQAWKVLQEHACKIIASNDLSIASHNLRLGESSLKFNILIDGANQQSQSSYLCGQTLVRNRL
jgi:hypothetical protein